MNSRRTGDIITLQSGFTLVELLIVIAIIGILGSIVLSSLNSARDQAKIAAGLAFENQVHKKLYNCLVAQYDFEDTSNLGLDTSGYGRHGVNNGANSIEGVNNGSAANFNELGDDIYINSIDLSSTNEVAISFWFKNLDSSMQIIAEYSPNFNSNNTWLIDKSEHGVDGSLQLSDRGDSGYNIVYTKNAYNDNKWHHFFGVIDRNMGGRQSKIYIDGKEDTVQHTSYNRDNSNNYPGPFPIYLGARGGSSYSYNGQLDNFRIYSCTSLAN